MSGNLLDTSVLIAVLDERTTLEDDSAISVVTVGELQAGVDLAKTREVRSARQARFRQVSQAFEPIPIDESIAMEYGRLLALARKSGRIQKATDLFIAATAEVTARTLWTRDQFQASLASEAGIATRAI